MRIALFNLSMSGFQELLLEKKYRDYEVNNNNGKLYFGSFFLVFQLMTSTLDNSFLSSDQDTNQFLV